MSRSNYTEELDQWDLIRWRGAVKSAIRGVRGQRLLRDLIAGFDALPHPRLIANRFREDGEVCALGAAYFHRKIKLPPDVDSWDVDNEATAKDLDVAEALVREVEYLNDEGTWARETPEDRFQRMRAWVVKNLKEQP